MKFSKEENIMLEWVVGNEIKSLVNEYDNDTRRPPGKRRMANLPILLDWHKKFTDIQDRYGAVHHHEKLGALLTPEKFEGSDMEFTDVESRIIKGLLEKERKSYQQYILCNASVPEHPMHKELKTIESLLEKIP